MLTLLRRCCRDSWTGLLVATTLSCISCTAPPESDVSEPALPGSNAPEAPIASESRDESGAGAPANAGSETARKTETETETLGRRPDLKTPAALEPPYLIDIENIVRIVHANSPRVRARREAMVAARHGLEEFQTNLSRFEPFVETRADLADFPHRDGAFGTNMEAVAGIQKETFEGGLLRLESGGSYSNFKFSDLVNDQREEGGGLLVRGRLEKPFLGSRRRQNRVISQAFQESSARKAQLDYFDAYRDYVDNALSYYILYDYYNRLVEVYERYIADLRGILEDPRLKEADRGRLESERVTAETNRNQYESSRGEYLIYLLAELGIRGGEEYQIEPPPPYRLSPYAAQAENPDELEMLIARARENNPTFSVLGDAIKNSSLQRRQAMEGRYDVTTFLEGTLFPVGSETFDDRLDGWLVGGGVTVRLNDQRVLTATRLKAEAEIREFKARLEAEELLMRRRITTEARGLLDNHRNRETLLEARGQKLRVFEQRREEYFAGTVNINQVVDARSTLTSTESSLASNLYNTHNRERRLMGATGRIYDIVGLRMARN